MRWKKPCRGWSVNRSALENLAGEKDMVIVTGGAAHLFEEPGKLEKVARLNRDWSSKSFVVVLGK
jgi:hypothetical protein